MEKRLDLSQFARVHRTAIVNIDRIKELRPHFHGDYQILLITGAKLTLSRRYRDNLRHLIADQI